ncbi:MAG: chaplin, partial [Hamadaea sp.]|nr:chaplin [Hamadaea sp.]
MKTWVRRSLNAGALTAGALLVTGTAAGSAHADATLVSSDNIGILNGTQVLLPVQAPIDVCGNAVAVAGLAAAGCTGGSAATLSPEWGWAHYQARTSDNIGILNGTQVIAPIQVPIDVCGNAVGVLGKAYAGCQGGSSAKIGGHGHKKKHGNGCGCYHNTEATEAGATEGLVDGIPAVGDLLGGLTGGSSGVPVVGGLLSGLVSGSPAASVLNATPAGDLLGGASILPAAGEPEILESTGGPTYTGGQGGGKQKPKPTPRPDCGCDGGHGGHGHGGPKLVST